MPEMCLLCGTYIPQTGIWYQTCPRCKRVTARMLRERKTTEEREKRHRKKVQAYKDAKAKRKP